MSKHHLPRKHSCYHSLFTNKERHQPEPMDIDGGDTSANPGTVQPNPGTVDDTSAEALQVEPMEVDGLFLWLVVVLG